MSSDAAGSIDVLTLEATDMENQTCYCTTMRKAARRLTAIYDEALAPAGISLAQLSLMRNIARAERITVGDLGRLIELDRSTTGRNVRVLAKMGLAALLPSDDGRETIITVSEEGRRVLDEAAPLWETAQRGVEAKLGLNAELLLEMVGQL